MAVDVALDIGLRVRGAKKTDDILLDAEELLVTTYIECPGQEHVQVKKDEVHGGRIAAVLGEVGARLVVARDREVRDAEMLGVVAVRAPGVLGGVARCDDFLAQDSAAGLAHLAAGEDASGRVGAVVLGEAHGREIVALGNRALVEPREDEVSLETGKRG